MLAGDTFLSQEVLYPREAQYLLWVVLLVSLVTTLLQDRTAYCSAVQQQEHSPPEGAPSCVPEAGLGWAGLRAGGEQSAAGCPIPGEGGGPSTTSSSHTPAGGTDRQDISSWGHILAYTLTPRLGMP